jgi:hypothetical protein
MPPTIGDYHRVVIEDAKKDINSTPDDRVLGMDATEWTDYLMRKWGMSEIEIDESRDVGMSEVDREYRLRGYDIRTDRGPGSLVRDTAVRIQIPVTPSDTLEAIWHQKLAPNTYSLSHGYPPFAYDHAHGLFTDVVNPDVASVKRGIELIKSTVGAYNESIRQETPPFRQQIAQAVSQKRDHVLRKHKGLDALAAEVGIPLRKKVDISEVIPTAPKVRAVIAPILPPAHKTPTRPVLEPDKFAAILDLIDNSGRQFERTPQSFQQLTEEGLRDIILGSLNAVFEGAAGGETFQGIGKVDIHLRITQGEVFLAELKFWDGPESLKEVVKQLRNRLTWRDSFGVAVVLSRNAGFTEVLKGVRETIAVCEGFSGKMGQGKGENHVVARFAIPSDDARQATIHVLVYNLYVTEPGKRTVKRVR